MLGPGEGLCGVVHCSKPWSSVRRLQTIGLQSASCWGRAANPSHPIPVFAAAQDCSAVKSQVSNVTAEFTSRVGSAPTNYAELINSLERKRSRRLLGRPTCPFSRQSLDEGRTVSNSSENSALPRLLKRQTPRSLRDLGAYYGSKIAGAPCIRRHRATQPPASSPS